MINGINDSTPKADIPITDNIVISHISICGYIRKSSWPVAKANSTVVNIPRESTVKTVSAFVKENNKTDIKTNNNKDITTEE